MSFTDDDLKRLKGYIDNHEFPEQGSGLVVALLARLEAAERIVDCYCGVLPAIKAPQYYKAWRASKGEGNELA